MGHGMSLTRQDALPRVAERFVDAGLVVVTFDYRHWGDSDGEPRQWVSIKRQRQDWEAAVSFARRLDGVDPSRVAVWGMSFGGGHALATAADDPGIAAVIALVPFVDGLAAWLQPAPLGQSMRMVSRAARELVTRRPVYAPLTAPPGDFAVLAAPEGVGGFRSVTAGRDWTNEVSTSWLLWVAGYRPGRSASRITAPVLFQIGDDDGMAPAALIEKAAARAARAEVVHYAMYHFGAFTPQHENVIDDESSFLLRHLLTARSS